MSKISKLHPLAEITRKNIKKFRIEKGCFICREGLNMRISPQSFRRALRFMDTLLKKLEENKISVTLTKEGYKNIISLSVSGVNLEM